MSGAESCPAPGAGAQRRGAAPVFTEKTFYLEEFYGKSLLFALVPPAGERMNELDALVRTLRELRRNQTRCVVMAPPDALARLTRRMGRMAPPAPPPVFNPAAGMRTRPYPPDAAVARIWSALRAGSIVLASTSGDDPEDFLIFVHELAARLRVFKLILLDRAGGLAGEDGGRMSFVESSRMGRVLRRVQSKPRRKLVRLAAAALKKGVGSVNLVAPREAYEELFSFSGTGTLFTAAQYGLVRPVSIDDFEEVEALIRRGQDEGFLLPRTSEELSRLLPSCFGYRVGDEHLAGICSLLTEPYRRERAGELAALYTLTRFQREGVAAELVREIIAEARRRRLKWLFACTREERAARFFERMKFRKARPDHAPAEKWRGYDSARIAGLRVFRLDLA